MKLGGRNKRRFEEGSLHGEILLRKKGEPKQSGSFFFSESSRYTQKVLHRHFLHQRVRDLCIYYK